MTNLECVMYALAKHREARQWSDEAVALDLLAQLGVDPGGDAAHAAPLVDPSLVTEDQVVAAERTAQEALEKAKNARAALDAQARDEPQNMTSPERQEAERTAAYRQQMDAALGQQQAPAFVPPGEHIDPAPVGENLPHE
jgi:hypothetical protein